MFILIGIVVWRDKLVNFEINCTRIISKYIERLIFLSFYGKNYFDNILVQLISKVTSLSLHTTFHMSMNISDYHNGGWDRRTRASKDLSSLVHHLKVPGCKGTIDYPLSLRFRSPDQFIFKWLEVSPTPFGITNTTNNHLTFYRLENCQDSRAKRSILIRKKVR